MGSCSHRQWSKLSHQGHTYRNSVNEDTPLAWWMCREKMFDGAMSAGSHLQRRWANVCRISLYCHSHDQFYDWGLFWSVCWGGSLGPSLHIHVNNHHWGWMLCLTEVCTLNPILFLDAKLPTDTLEHVPALSCSVAMLLHVSIPWQQQLELWDNPGASMCSSTSFYPCCSLDAQEDWPFWVSQEKWE